MNAKSLILSYFLIVSMSCYSQNSLDIRFQPDKTLYLYETKGIGTPGELYTGVLQNIAVVNLTADSLSVDEITIEVFKKDAMLQCLIIGKESLDIFAKRMKAFEDQGLLEVFDFQFQLSGYLPEAKLAASAALAPGQSIILTHRTLLCQELPDKVKIKAMAHNSSKQEIVVENSISVNNYRSQNQYQFPLTGQWALYGAPSLISHHRWASIQEFAFDLIKIGDKGKTYKSDGSRPEDYYSFGETVYSVAEGKVIAVYNESEDNASLLRRANEPFDQYLGRISISQQELLLKGFALIMGNYVIIEHDHGEYSYYMHLMHKSVKVKPGDQVKAGQPIGAVGQSGNSTEPHLHFQIADSPEIAYCRSLPVQFEQIELWPDDLPEIKHLHYGQAVINKIKL